MKKKLSAVISLILCFTMFFSCVAVSAYADESTSSEEKAVEITKDYSYLTAENINPDEISNTVVIPGVFQSKTRLYNEDGSLAHDAEGNEYEAPFFLETTSDIVKVALKKCLFPLLLTLLTQHDFGHKLAKNLADTIGWAVGGKAETTSDGKFVYNVKADKYDGPLSTLTEADKNYIYDQIPLKDYADIVGEDHLYFYSYCSFGNIDSIVDELYNLIVKAAESSPTGKANIIPISQGGSLANDLLGRHPEVGKYLDRIVYIVPALDGTVLLGEIYENGIIDDDSALYDEIFPVLINDDNTPWLGSLINIVLRIFPNAVLNDILDRAVDTLISDYIKNCTTMWALIPQANYKAAADKYLSGAENAIIRSQTDKFHEYQVNSDANILNQINTYGIEVFDVVDYNSVLYPICDSWNKMNGDGIIQVDSTSMGATSVAVDVPLPDSYVSAKGEKYVDKYRLVDAGTGLLPDNTFYFHNQNHEKTARNDVIMKLAICLITDDNFKSIDSYPDKYPQFNECRISKNIINDLPAIREMATDDISAEDKAELIAACDEMQRQIDSTVVDTQAFEAASERVYAIRNKINGVSDKESLGDKISDSLNSALTVSIEKLSKALYKLLGGKGFSDIFRIVK